MRGCHLAVRCAACDIQATSKLKIKIKIKLHREVEAAKAVGSGFRREWRDSCVSNHSDWKYMFWDKAAALAFLRAHYPWYISTFLSYPKVVLQGAFPLSAPPGYIIPLKLMRSSGACGLRWAKIASEHAG